MISLMGIVAVHVEREVPQVSHHPLGKRGCSSGEPLFPLYQPRDRGGKDKGAQQREE